MLKAKSRIGECIFKKITFFLASCLFQLNAFLVMCHVHEIQEDICNQEFQRLKIGFLASNFSKTTKSKPFTHYAAQPRKLNNNESNKID